MYDRDDIERLKADNRRYEEIIRESKARNPQYAQELQEKIDRNIISIQRAERGRE
jgi:hypothetical protein